ncbi:MAG TPA: prolyl oligopeptidase family serine peptidase [Planctomycetaceae bacterium]|nr:prolyl oligopeptidase family serine peptidase [Planctomycetaceae bacterium]
MRSIALLLLAWAAMWPGANAAKAQALGEPARGEPGDRMIQEYLARIASDLQATFADDVASPAKWQTHRPRYREEYLYMLGLSPLPERAPMHATVTGTLDGDGFVVDMLHYQSRPGLYVTANLYRPAQIQSKERLPAVLYVCGHSGRGRDGNKTAFQSHGMWFARHGYVCLIVDTLQLGEIAANHHGTYRENRWWWHSRGYTPAGVECWNGVRGIDYLISRPDVDPERIAVTGISGGGAATFWIAAADERVKVAVPVSGMADLASYVPNRVINGHCDCMFLYNTFEWPWTRIAGLVAPRPLLFVNSDADAIFPMDANERVISQLEKLYSLYGAGDRVDAVVSVGGHAYRQDIRQAAYRFINLYLKTDARPVTDSEVDIVEDPPAKVVHPIEPERLRVFPTDRDIPSDQLNTTIDQHFVPMAHVATPTHDNFDDWKLALTTELRRVVFGSFPERIPAARVVKQDSPQVARLETEEGISVRLETLADPAPGAQPRRILLFVQNWGNDSPLPAWFEKTRRTHDHVLRCEPRGVGDTRWSSKNPPNYILRSHVLLGRTVDTGRVFDLIAIARYLRETYKNVPIFVVGEGPGAVLAGYAAALEPDIAGVIAYDPPKTHMNSAAPQFLNVLRVGDIPQILGLLAPRPLTILNADDEFKATAAIFDAAGAAERFTLDR